MYDFQRERYLLKIELEIVLLLESILQVLSYKEFY